MAVFCAVSLPISPLLAQSRTAQVMILPDPTPREPDLEKRFNTSPAPFAANPARVAAYNRQRFQLIGQASAHLRSMANALQVSVAQHGEATALPQETQLAGAIEALATNVYTAMLPSPSRPAGKTDKDPSAETIGTSEAPRLLADTRRLSALTEALETEVNKSSADTLAVGIVIKSAQVKELAHSLKERLQLQQTAHP